MLRAYACGMSLLFAVAYAEREASMPCCDYLTLRFGNNRWEFVYFGNQNKQQKI